MSVFHNENTEIAIVRVEIQLLPALSSPNISTRTSVLPNSFPNKLEINKPID